jgi:membrane dipeptidase
MHERGLDPRDIDSREQLGQERAAADPRPTATLAQVAAHIEYVREVAGIEHVGLGGDFDGTFQLPDGLADVSCYPALLAELLSRGWTEDDCARLAGGNLLRVLGEAEEAARVLAGRRAPCTARIEDLDGG